MRIADFRERHRGARAWVIGSGPSLAEMDLSPLRSALTLTCNNGHLLFERLGGPSTYWCTEDPLDWQQFRKAWSAIGSVRVIADDLEEDEAFGACVRVPFARAYYGADGPQFWRDGCFFWGATVSYLMIQWAVYVGAAEIVLLGHDFRYALDGSEDGNTWSINADLSHFDREYWPPGARAFKPDYVAMRRAFVAAQAACAQAGITIVNATPGTALDVFQLADYGALVAEGRS